MHTYIHTQYEEQAPHTGLHRYIYVFMNVLCHAHECTLSDHKFDVKECRSARIDGTLKQRNIISQLAIL